MPINKTIFYIKHLFKMCFYNKFRFFLSIIGLFIGLFIFTTGNILIDSYYNELSKESKQMDNRVVALNYEFGEEINGNEIYNDFASSNVQIISAEQKTNIFAKIYENEYICTLSANIMGVSNIDNVIPVLSSNGDFIITKTELLKGRLINNFDIINNSNVVVIDEFTEKLLFPNGNSIGSKITLDVTIPGSSNVTTNENKQEDKKQCTVIGVVKSSYFQNQEEMKYNKFVSDPIETINLKTIIYSPLSYVKSNFDISLNKSIIWLNADKQKVKNNLNIYKNKSFKDFSLYEIVDKDYIKDKVDNELKPLKIFFILVLVILLIISGINAMGTMFFSIKERINEIGIKKALGATKIDILSQFIIEGIIMAVIASIIAIIFSCITVLLIKLYINHKMFILFDINFTFSNLIIPILVSVIYAFVFSIIPSYYGAKIKITDSLRFE